MKKDDGVNDGLYNDRPEHPSVSHPVNYLKYIGDRVKRHRLSLSINDRSETSFGSKLKKYFGKPISRSSIQRAEEGRHSTQWGVIAAYFFEMGVFPEIVKVLERGRTSTLHTALLSKKTVQLELEKAKEIGDQRLQERANTEKQAGVVIK
ncbi:hypothetical protein [Alteromonas stellipolaris]|uniref:XRE family transcriptional regulator n=1 Tax=Alteromonas stellipolaris TaxID=233316 RepID=A0ABN4LRZ2_9ALTE|nr:hypothetical protein AVL57_00990 [Alteromonas stellipolaris]